MCKLDPFGVGDYNAAVGVYEPASFGLTLQFPQGKDFRQGMERGNDGKWLLAVRIEMQSAPLVDVYAG